MSRVKDVSLNPDVQHRFMCNPGKVSVSLRPLSLPLAKNVLLPSGSSAQMTGATPLLPILCRMACSRMKISVPLKTVYGSGPD